MGILSSAKLLAHNHIFHLESLYHKNYGRSFAETFVKKRPNSAYIYLEMPDVYMTKANIAFASLVSLVNSW